MKKKIFILCLFMFLSINYKVFGAEVSYEVHFINTGQSDCTLIKAGEKNYLIDTAANYNSDKILKYLKTMNVNKIDSIIITHLHDDHYGGLKNIISSIKVDAVVLPAHQGKFRDYLFGYLTEKKIKVENVSSDFRILGDKIDLKAILPSKEDLEIENNNSVVITGTIDGIKYIFMGDGEKSEEKDLVNNELVKPCDIIKIPHHGLATSSSDLLLKTVKAKYAVVTSNGGESPSYDIINRISSYGTAILRTDIQGDIVISNKEGIEINTNKMVQ